MKNVFLGLLTLFLCSFSVNEPIKIVFFGDSITQQGVQPKGYVTQIKEYANKTYPGKYEVIGSGIGGNKVYDLYLRFEEMMSNNPDIVVIYIGINDVWHKTSSGTGTDPDKFVRFYQRIIEKLKADKVRVILATPSVIGERYDASNPQDGDLNHYSKLIRDLAKRYELPLVDLRQAFLDYSKHYNKNNEEKGILTTDRVHLNDEGNALVAKEMIKVIF